jgi:SAM-dependent methyltransferase
MDRVERESRRDTFLNVAHDYAAVRPEYPSELLEAAVRLVGLEAGARVLEIGCGTGQVTRWLAERGHEVLALDRSQEMVSYAGRALSAYPRVKIRCQDFEELLPERAYDAIVAASSYHWLDPADRVERCAGHLVPGGALILLWHTHPPPFIGYFERVRPIYRGLLPEWAPPPSPGIIEDQLRSIHRELERSGSFGSSARRSHDWTRVYEREDYLRLLATYSDHMLLPDDRRARLFAQIAKLIDAEFDGRVVRPYRTELMVCRLA